MPVLLAIESSQHVGGVALRDHAGAVHVEMLSPRKRHDDDLLPAIDRLFKRADLTPNDLRSTANGVVAVSIGPGGFTGLRLAVSIAKMFAETLGTKVVAVPSALVAAESFQLKECRAASHRNIIVTLASKADFCWCMRLLHDGQSWRIDGQPGVCNAAGLDLRAVDSVLADEHFPEPMRRQCEVSGVNVIEPQFDPRACLSVAQRMINEGVLSDPLRLVPLYPREPEAVTLWNQKERLTTAVHRGRSTS